MKARHPLRKVLLALLLLLILVVAGIYLFFFPHVYQSYLDALPAADECQMSIFTYGGQDFEPDLAQREEILELLKETKYGFPYGPEAPSAINWSGKAGMGFSITIESPDEYGNYVTFCERYSVHYNDYTKCGFVYYLPSGSLCYRLSPKSGEALYTALTRMEGELAS